MKPLALAISLLTGCMLWLASTSLAMSGEKSTEKSIENSIEKSGEKVAAESLYSCPMHPHYIAQTPGNCPICGMDLVIKTKPTDTDPSAKGAGPTSSGPPSIRIASHMQQRLGLRTGWLERVHFKRQVRAFASLTANPRLRSQVASRSGGWVERLYVSANGDPVVRGQPLMEIYSPDIDAAQGDYLSALASRASGRIEATAKRLKALGMHPQDLAKIRRQRKALALLPLYANASGVVESLNLSLGSYVQPGEELLSIQNYQQLWLLAQLSETQAQGLAPGDAAEVRWLGRPTAGQSANQQSPPGHSFKAHYQAQIDYLYPELLLPQRRIQIRLLIDNPAAGSGDAQPSSKATAALKAGGYAEVRFTAQQASRWGIPREALLRDGQNTYVIRVLSEGRFQRQAVQTGLQSADFIEITQGLAPHDQVVISGQFLLDSEISLQASQQRFLGAATRLAELNLTDRQLALMDHLIDAALYLYKGLKGDHVFYAPMLKASIDAIDLLNPEYRDTSLGFVLRKARLALVKAQDSVADSQRQTALAELIWALKPWLLQGRPAHYADQGLVLFADTAGSENDAQPTSFQPGQAPLWLQFGPRSWNPYGKRPGRRLSWPTHGQDGRATALDSATHQLTPGYTPGASDPGHNLAPPSPPSASSAKNHGGAHVH